VTLSRLAGKPSQLDQNEARDFQSAPNGDKQAGQKSAAARQIDDEK
jgi:hypothetical protein